MKKDTKLFIEAMSAGPVRQYISDHEHDDLRAVILKNKEIFGLPASAVVDQIASRKKAKEKLPLFYANAAVVYPAPINLEQSSSQETAVFKSGIIARLTGDSARVLDLTGGFGVDAYFISKSVRELHYVEPDGSLLDIARHNHRLLGATNIYYHTSTAEQFLSGSTDIFDVIYIDPSRRTGDGKKVNSLADSQPNMLDITDRLFRMTRRVVVKTSPLLDLHVGISQLPFVKDVYVISVNNECKELLFVAEKNFAQVPLIHAVNIADGGFNETFTFTFPEERGAITSFDDPSQYLFEPNASILKAGAFKLIGERFNLKKLAASTHLYTGDQLLEFPGRRFHIEALVRPEAKEIERHFPSGKANVITRNYPLTADALKKKIRLQDGGEKYLIGFSGSRKKFLAVAERV